MSMDVPRSVIVDDVDTSIQYTGPWYQFEGSPSPDSLLGPPYRSTLHGTNASASLAFAFNGERHFFFVNSPKFEIDQDFRNSDQSTWDQ